MADLFVHAMRRWYRCQRDGELCYASDDSEDSIQESKRRPLFIIARMICFTILWNGAPCCFIIIGNILNEENSFISHWAPLSVFIIIMYGIHAVSWWIFFTHSINILNLFFVRCPRISQYFCLVFFFSYLFLIFSENQIFCCFQWFWCWLDHFILLWMCAKKMSILNTWYYHS